MVKYRNKGNTKTTFLKYIFMDDFIYEKKSFSIDLSIGDHLDKW